MSILRDKVNEMYDRFATHIESGDEMRFRVQILNALYVIADQLDRLETPSQPIKTAERAPVASQPMSCTCLGIENGEMFLPLMTNPLCPIHGDVRDHGAVSCPDCGGVGLPDGCNICGRRMVLPEDARQAYLDAAEAQWERDQMRDPRA